MSDEQAQLREDARRVLAWHDATCELEDTCPNRYEHGRAHPMVTSGTVDRFVEFLDEARGQDETIRRDRG